MKFSVIHVDGLQWGVLNDDGKVVASGLTNAQAWREADRLAGEVISKSESTAKWAFNKTAHNE